MSCLRACFRVRGPRANTAATKRQNSSQEQEVIELQEDNDMGESEADPGNPLNARTRKVGISLDHLVLAVGENTTRQVK